MLLLGTVLSGRAVTLVWDANSETNIAGYIVHYGTTSRSYTNHNIVGNVTTNQIAGLASGRTYYFAVTAYDTLGLESDYSNEVAYSPISSAASNNPPVIILPGPVSVQTGAAISIGGIQTSDSDAGTNTLSLGLSVSNGILILATNVGNGVTASQVQGNRSSDVQIYASLIAFNTTFSNANGLVYQPRLNYVGTDTLLATLNDNGNSGIGEPGIDTKQLVITVAGTSLDVWRNRYFAAADLSTPGKEETVWGDSADPDNDGVDNLMEFALGLVPTLPGAAQEGLASQLSEVNGNNHLLLIFKHRKSDPVLQYIAEVSGDLVSWSSATSAIQQVGVINYDNEFETITFMDQTAVVPGRARFVRLRVIKTGF
jgi:hypothetical protein